MLLVIFPTIFVGIVSDIDLSSSIKLSHFTMASLFKAFFFISTLPRYVAFPPFPAILLETILLLVFFPI